MSNYVPEDVQDLVKEIVIYQEKEKREETEEELFDRLYLEIMPEEPEDIKEDEAKNSSVIVIEL